MAVVARSKWDIVAAIWECWVAQGIGPRLLIATCQIALVAAAVTGYRFEDHSVTWDWLIKAIGRQTTWPEHCLDAA